MTNTEKLFLELLSYHINGTPVTISDFDTDELLSLAVKHKLVSIIYSTAAKCALPFSENASAVFKNSARLEAVSGIRRSVAFIKLYEDLSAAGISPIVVKGSVLGSLYPVRDTRHSSDEDLLFTKEQLSTAQNIFEKNGLIKNDSSEDDTVWGYRNPANGLYIEAHTSLFPQYPAHNAVMNQMFENAQKNSVSVPVNGTEMRTLCETEHLLFLILHSFKHFVYCGFGIRQVTDFIVYARSVKGKADTAKIMENLAKVNAAGFFDALLSVCREYFGIFPDELGFENYTPTDYDINDFITDILSGGAYGNSSKERLHSSKITLAATEKNGKASAVSSLFPPVGALKSAYPYLSKHPYLLPVAWCSRIIKHLTKDKSERQFDAGKTVEIGKERIRMMKKYGIIE